MYYNRNWSFGREIGTAWYGRHVVIIRCNPYLNKLIQVDKSLHAPTELPHENCAETIAQYFSIGYELMGITTISQNEVLYILRK